MDVVLNFNLWLAFVAATAVLALIPGPIVTLVVANSLSQGARAGVMNVLGTLAGNAILLAVGGFGMAWVLAVLADWFDLLRWAGAAYLVYLGIKQWLAKPVGLEEMQPTQSGRSLFGQGALVALTNPKTIFFFAAFFPQFMDAALPAGGQLLSLSITFLVVAGLCDMGYALLAGRLRPWLTGPHRGRIRNRLSGALLVGTGAALALSRRAG